MCLELEPLALKTRLSEAVTTCLTLDLVSLRVTVPRLGMVGSENTYPSLFRNYFPRAISSFQLLPNTEQEVLSSFTITEYDTCAFFLHTSS